MIFVDNKAKIFSVGYTAWAFYALAAITVAPDALWFLFEFQTNPVVWGWLQIVAIAFGLVGRSLDQPKENRWIRRAIVAMFVIVISCVSIPALAHDYSCAELGPYTTEREIPVTVTLVKLWEGEHKVKGEHIGYLDTIAEPDLPTACYGHTETAVVGKVYTQKQCDDLLAKDIVVYRDGIRAAMTWESRQYRLTDKRAAAFTSLTYNVGIRAAGKSTAVRRLNRGDIEGGCEAIAWWNRAGGRVVRGLANRRSEEVAYCLQGLT